MDQSVSLSKQGLLKTLWQCSVLPSFQIDSTWNALSHPVLPQQNNSKIQDFCRTAYCFSSEKELKQNYPRFGCLLISSFFSWSRSLWCSGEQAFWQKENYLGQRRWPISCMASCPFAMIHTLYLWFQLFSSLVFSQCTTMVTEWVPLGHWQTGLI